MIRARELPLPLAVQTCQHRDGTEQYQRSPGNDSQHLFRVAQFCLLLVDGVEQFLHFEAFDDADACALLAVGIAAWLTENPGKTCYLFNAGSTPSTDVPVLALLTSTGDSGIPRK